MSRAAVTVRCRGVTFGFGRRPVLEGITFELRAGEAACLVGPNGGGKTTLLRLLLGLLEPQSGEIELLGQRPLEARPEVGYMPQYLHYDQRFPITVEEVVRQGRPGQGPFGWLSREDRQVAARALDEVGLTARAKEPFAELSGGQRQRVLIARALACEPKVLLLDEPTAMVDVTVERDLREVLERLKGQMTILLVSHDLAFVSSLVDRVLCVQRTLVEHPMSELTSEKLGALYGDEVQAIRHNHHLRATEEGREP